MAGDYPGNPTRTNARQQAVSDCHICNGAGWLSSNVPVGHPDFGQAFPCRCLRSDADATTRTAALERYSKLGPLRQFTLAAADPDRYISNPANRRAFSGALDAAAEYAEQPSGWISFAGPSGSGKSYLAAAIANRQIELGQPALFVTAADLLDYLRGGFDDDEELTFVDLFEQVRNAPLLILDDLPTNPATPWGQDRLFQLLAHRHSSRLPTVITLRGDPDRADEFLRSRLASIDGFSRLYQLGRHGEALTRVAGEVPPNMRRRMTFDSFHTDGNGQLTREQCVSLAGIHGYIKRWVERPAGWLNLSGPFGVGKTHLAVAAAVERESQGDDVFFATVADLLDYLRATFNPDSPITHDDLLHRIRMADFLVLDDMGAERSTPFAEDKLFQIINYRYEERLPTIVTTSNRLADIAASRPRIASRLQDSLVITNLPLEGPDYRQSHGRP